ncbi:MAG: outer membrane beta-barrel protein [Limisphaerales bacterium]|jgi:hypothetical protein
MKKIIASVGAVALGLAGAQGVFAQAQLESSEKSLPWLSASLSVRGFYDDNITSSWKGTLPTGVEVDPKDSFGFQIVPSVGLKYQDELTLASIRYEYGYTYYADRASPKYDQSHLVDAVFNRQFSDNVRLELSNSFAVAQEPEVLSDFVGQQFMTRAEGDNIRNFAEALLGVKYYENLGFEVGYRNAYWDFENDDYAFILNRMEHTPHVDLYYDLDDVNRLFVGYQFNFADYDGSGQRDLYGVDGQKLYDVTGMRATYGSDLYDRMSHSGYVGYRLTLDKGLDWTTRLGVQYTSFRNVKDYRDQGYWYEDPTSPGVLLPGGRVDLSKDATNPFVESIFRWAYHENGTAQLGVRHEIGASQWGAMEAEVTTLFASVRHLITPRLEGALSGVYQHSSYGASPSSQISDNTHDDYFSIGPSLSYRITGFDCPIGTFVDLSYSYDNLSSNIDYRDYDRNRVTLGLRATY